MIKYICRTVLLAFVFVLALQPLVHAQQASPMDFSGVWKDPFDETCWVYKFIVVENDLVIRTSCAGRSDEIFGRAKLNGRQFTGRINTAPSPDGGSRYPGNIEGRIGDDNKIIYMTWPWRDGPHSARLVKE
jgi:hypothetical protein